MRWELALALVAGVVWSGCAVDTFGQTCPPGGVVELTYQVVDATCYEQVTEARCAAWWPDGGGDDMTTTVVEVDGRCITRSQWFSRADYESDPRVRSYNGGECSLEGKVPCG